MPMFMDIHTIPGITREDLAKAHEADMKIQARFGVEYHKYWMNETTGKVYCLCTAPDAGAAESVHRESHGAEADRIIEVTPDLAEAFMGAAEADPQGAAMLPGNSSRDSGIRTVLFTDIVGSTDMTQRLGDEVAMEVLAVHDQIVRGALAVTGGREIKHTGDGIMAAFLSAASAIRCGLNVHQELARHSSQSPDRPLKVRIGLAAGEPVERQNDFFGSTVQLAARLCAYAEPQQILVSNVVAELCLGKGLAFRDLGVVSLKGFEQPVHVHTVVA
jgi:class 3 adenylate cyclase